MLIDRERSILLVIDVQERLAASISRIEPIVAAIGRLIDAATRLRVPVCATEHCPERIGPTIDVLRRRLADDQIARKVHFAASAEDVFRQRMRALQRRQVIVCGTEAHVCVLQTALLMQAQGFDAFMVTDASASRYPSDRDAAFRRARDDGVRAVTAEMVMFEWLGRADVPEFRELLPVIKSRG